MARDFSKNTSNHLSFGNGAIGALLNGLTEISAHAWVNADTYGTALDDNTVLAVYINGTSVAFRISVDSSAGGGAGNLQMSGRSQSADSIQRVEGTIAANAGGLLSLGGVSVIAATDKLRGYVNGALDFNTTVTYGAASWTQGTPSIPDRIGAGTLATGPQWDGMIGEVAIWGVDIGDIGFYQLGKGASPLLVRPEGLLMYVPMWGDYSPERDFINSLAGTITGSLPKLAHPRIFMPQSFALDAFDELLPIKAPMFAGAVLVG